jgi:hypothetical protein
VGDSLQNLKGIHSISNSLSRVHDELDLPKLVYVRDATYDSAGEGNLPVEGTSLYVVVSL